MDHFNRKERKVKILKLWSLRSLRKFFAPSAVKGFRLLQRHDKYLIWITLLSD
jgi:hypothetical protein